MGFVVKNTIIQWWADLLCPNTCVSCGRLGPILCERCKNNILRERKPVCPLCKEMLKTDKNGMIAERCAKCELPFDMLQVVGWKDATLSKLVEEYKYQSRKDVGWILADLLFSCLPPDLTARFEPVTIVPLPTIGKHVRQRGFDHTLYLAKCLSRMSGWSYERLLFRKRDTVQVGKTMSERREQAKNAYEARAEVDGAKSYLLLDDVWTTGASMLAAAEAMKGAGAKRLLGATIVTTKPKNNQMN